ncbi:MAG: signal peptidase II, partial [Planctomycetota bacterium]
GAVFGLGAGKRWVFISVSIVAVFVLSWLFWFSPRGAWIYHLSLALVLAGALGNLYDRVLYGAVRDMLHMLPGVELPFGLRWPGQGGMRGSSEVWPWVFNLADMSLLAGVAGVMIETWRGVGMPESAKSAKPASVDEPSSPT